MKKITLFLVAFLMTSFAFCQTYSTGEIVLLDDGELYYSAQIDVTSTLVTLTLDGPDNRFLGLGFGTSSMIAGDDVVIYDGASISDRYFGLPGQPDGSDAIGIEPSVDANQNWTITSNTLDGEQRTIVATRALDTGETNDYVFSTSDTSIELVWSFGFSYTIGYHGENKGVTMQSFTLGDEEVSQASQEFTISPNPATTKLNIRLPQGQQNAVVNVYDVLGKRVYSKELNSLTASIDVSKWNTGVYLVKVSANNFTQTRRFVKQ
ncbi:T9SS type A sorting domain-containing protein [Meridianimaribacter flavus]|uniref:Secreted protein (Por secretion system target) n=1 Tax=Meridianimaribacter flavus TaxID=571115 RepID=A0ABY2G506_9FLAO|nr:T9SS type A sorting domain-containing protein [Meridianimaribacter flavus]TDY11891.1 putative secreted protein (Por secretion system target) [Meridianimaribacter flavus]